MTVTWASTSPRLAAERNRPLMIENAMIDRSRTASGPRIGLACRTCWMRRPSDSGLRCSNPVSGSGVRVAVPPPDEASFAIGTSRS